MPLPVVAIVGRPNVGKSSLFNTLIRRRTSIVEPTPGVTRDRVSALCPIDHRYVDLVDTGGFGVVDRDDLSDHVERQIRFAIEQAHLILFIVDAREGLNPLDRQTAELLRRHSGRVRLIANKADEPHLAPGLSEFARLGFGEPLPVSALNGSGRSDLEELIKESLSNTEQETPPDPVMKIAIVGKRNAGKSSFINALAGEERVIVSEIPGTTRDSIDVHFEKDGRTLVAIDTAGVRKKSSIEDDIEFFAHSRATDSIARADVVLLMIDSTVPIGQVDKRLAQLIVSEAKPCVLVVNKWDLAKGGAKREDYEKYLVKVFPHLDYAPICLTSASLGRNIDATIDTATEVFKQSTTRITTGILNQALQDALNERGASPRKGRKAPKFYYATQVSTQPPTIVVFVNNPALVTQNFERFLLNRLRERLPFSKIPIRLLFRPRRERAATA